VLLFVSRASPTGGAAFAAHTDWRRAKFLPQQTGSSRWVTGLDGRWSSLGDLMVEIRVACVGERVESRLVGCSRLGY